MKASAVISHRRALGNWLAYALPDDHDDDSRTPDPPPEKKEAVPPRTADLGEPTPEPTSDNLLIQP